LPAKYKQHYRTSGNRTETNRISIYDLDSYDVKLPSLCVRYRVDTEYPCGHYLSFK